MEHTASHLQPAEQLSWKAPAFYVITEKQEKVILCSQARRFTDAIHKNTPSSTVFAATYCIEMKPCAKLMHTNLHQKILRGVDKGGHYAPKVSFHEPHFLFTSHTPVAQNLPH